MLDFSIEDILDIVTKVLQAFKDIFAWLGILIFPEEGEYDYPGSTTVSAEELVNEAP